MSSALDFVDERSGELYSPSRSMVTNSLGSAKALGLDPKSKTAPQISSSSISTNTIDDTLTVYGPRFVTYLTRFLLTFDAPAIRWWNGEVGSSFEMNDASAASFGRLTNSLLVGLSDYFTGPYGSYSSLKSAVAGINAKYQAKSGGSGSINGVKQGVLNLLALLKARYTSAEAKRQLAILFSFLDTSLQPVDEITSLLGEADNGFVQDVVIFNNANEVYIPDDGELVISDPPALGSEYLRAKGSFVTDKIIKKDGRRLKRLVEVKVVSGGSGYTSAVPVSVYCKSPSAPKTIIGTARIKARNTPQNKDNERTYPLPLTEISGDFQRLLPNAVRPFYDEKIQRYVIPLLGASGVENSTSASNKFRRSFKAYDTIFGPIGKSPSTRSALKLGSSEYARLALSGAASTIICRTLLNPLELAKTKIQLGAPEIIEEVRKRRGKTLPNSEPPPSPNVLPPPPSSVPTPTPLPRPATAINTISTVPPTTIEVLGAMVSLDGPSAVFQSADITFLASLVFGSFGFGATELFRRILIAMNESDPGSSTNYGVLLTAAAAATVVTSAIAAPFELLRVRSMSLSSKVWLGGVLTSVIEENDKEKKLKRSGSGDLMMGHEHPTSPFVQSVKNLIPLWGSFYPIVCRELPFAVTKFGAFELIVAIFDHGIGDTMGVKVGVGNDGLALSAISGALSGVVSAFVSHPADLILTLQSAPTEDGRKPSWLEIVEDKISQEGRLLNLFVGLNQRATFFFFVIGLQFLLYDYTKSLLGVGSDDLNLVLDVFYAIRVGLVEQLKAAGQL